MSKIKKDAHFPYYQNSVTIKIMALNLSMHVAILILTLTYTVLSKASVPDFAFSWLDDNNKFQAGDIATISIKVLGNFDSKGNKSLEQSSFKPILSVNGKAGNSSFVSGVFLDVSGDPGAWKLMFTPIMAGVFNVLISEDDFEVLDSSLHYEVQPGHIYPSACVASWLDHKNEFEAGAKAAILILGKDAFGNNISSAVEEPISSNFTVYATYINGSFVTELNVSSKGWNGMGYMIAEFLVVNAGNFLLYVEGDNQILNSCPLAFSVNPGPLDVSSCLAKFKFDSTSWQLFSKMEIFIHQQDQYGNLVPGLYPFDADIIEKHTNLSIPVPDLYFEEALPGIQLFSFSIQESGNFKLTIYDMKHNRTIANMPYDYTVFMGYCDGLKSIVNGTGLNNSVAGEQADFSVFLNDRYQYPSLVETERLRVEILKENDTYSVNSSVIPVQATNGSVLARGVRHDAISPSGFFAAPSVSPAPSIVQANTTAGSSKVLASTFNVVYTPEKSGCYEIRVFCGNIILNGGSPFKKEVKAGEVNTSISGVAIYDQKVPKLIKNDIVVELMDSFFNPVFSHESRLKMETLSSNHSGFKSWPFADNNDGSYTGQYLAHDVGTYEICISFDGKHLSPCPFVVNVYSSEYFPKAQNDDISVWEDESIAFDALSNDYFAGNNATIDEYSKPRHGSLLQNGRIFRYTPWKDLYGNDSFMYTLSDVNGNLATAAVNISILNIPPQFVTFPEQLQATEDVLSPKFGGFLGIGIRYTNPVENVSLTLGAQWGTVYLSPVPMQFWKPLWNGLTVKRGDGEKSDLILEGCVDALSFALQSVQYLGKENFYGKDILRLSAKNRNGKNDIDIPVVVEPINDAPYINVPNLKMLKSDEKGSLIFEKGKDKFNFSIGDPDVMNFPGGDAHFTVMFSAEVNDGFLTATLPAELIDTTELMFQDSFMWQPLQTYVSISRHFTVKAKGVRFHGSVNNCNSVMEQLLYTGGEYGGVLTLRLNDLGHYGCYPGCDENISIPLYAEATIKLLRGKPMNAFLSHSFGSAIIIEVALVSCLGVLLLYFTCKCAFLLVSERHKSDQPSAQHSSSPEKEAYSTGRKRTPFFRKEAFNFRQRSLSLGADATKGACQTTQASSTRFPQIQSGYKPLAIEE